MGRDGADSCDFISDNIDMFPTLSANPVTVLRLTSIFATLCEERR
jgi:hypothetical protein